MSAPEKGVTTMQGRRELLTGAARVLAAGALSPYFSGCTGDNDIGYLNDRALTSTVDFTGQGKKFNRTTIHYLAETGKAFPIVRTHLAQWVDGRTADVYVVSPEDILRSIKDKAARTLFQKAMDMAKDNVMQGKSQETVQNFIQQNDFPDKFMGAVFNFFQTKYPAVSGRQLRDNIHRFADRLVDGMPSVGTLFDKNTQNSALDLINPFGSNMKCNTVQ